MRINVMHSLPPPRFRPAGEDWVRYQFAFRIAGGGEGRDLKGTDSGSIKREAVLGESHGPAVQNNHPPSAPCLTFVALDQGAHGMPAPRPHEIKCMEQFKHLVLRLHPTGEGPP